MADDDALMREVQRGSREAFEQLFERYRGAIWRFFRRRIGDAGRAEELSQDVFVAVLQNAKRYQPRTTFRSYLFAIAWNILQAERRRAGRQAVEPLDAEAVSGPAADADAAIWVRHALSTLDPVDRDVLILREYDQLSYQEIADVHEMPLNTVRTRLFRARMALKAALDARPEGEQP
jgi:RNA polymerase sigma-70 factor, ECF subfamily